MRFVLPRDPDKQILYRILEGRKSGQAPVIRPTAASSANKPSSDTNTGVAPEGMVLSFGEDGGTPRTGNITISEGANVTITESGSGTDWDFEIMTASSKTCSFSIPHMFVQTHGVIAISGTSTMVLQYGFAYTLPAAASSLDAAVTNQVSSNFVTGAVTEYKQISATLRRSGGSLFNSIDYVLYGQVPRITNTIVGNITMAEMTADVSGESSYSFHVTDGTNVSASSGSQFSGIGSSFGRFSTGIVDVSSWGDALYWAFLFNGPSTDAGPDINAASVLDFHSVDFNFS